MFRVYKRKSSELAEMISETAALPHDSRYVLVMLGGEQNSHERLNAMRHDLKAALRTFKYIAQKSCNQYDANDPKDFKKIQAINEHVAKMSSILEGPIDEILSSL
jgi:hypothetical protein